MFQGYEELDATTFVQWGLSYVKSDDCFSALDYRTGMTDYKNFSAYLKKAATKMSRPEPYFLICGCKLEVGAPDPRHGWEQCPRDAATYGADAWRIAQDDYTWANVLTNANINAGLSEYETPGRYNDPDMLINTPLIPAGWPSIDACPNLDGWKGVRKRGFPAYSIKPVQARLQMSLWCMMASPLILSLNIRALSAYDLATYSNKDAIEINQDVLVLQGIRLQGGNLTTEPVRDVALGQESQTDSPSPPFGNFSNTNVWGKRLSNGSLALLFLNVGPTVSPSLTCDQDCLGRLFKATPPKAGSKYSVWDVWGQKQLPDIVAPLQLTSPPLATDGVHMIRLRPVPS